ncbi:MAG: biotin/lipoyl-binding protein [Acidobacteria bacterium]|nr:biotin/lipoyl-binding protein [Acidobacteriota bacterium]
MEGAPAAMNEAKVESMVWSLLDGHRQLEARVDREGEDYVVAFRGRKLRVQLEDPRAWNGSGAGKQSSGIAKITTPMPGKVVRVLVEVGAEVKAGDGVVVVEAMKMQNEMKSPIDGIVKQVAAVEGATVNGNQMLVVIEAHAG